VITPQTTKTHNRMKSLEWNNNNNWYVFLRWATTW